MKGYGEEEEEERESNNKQYMIYFSRNKASRKRDLVVSLFDLPI